MAVITRRIQPQGDVRLDYSNPLAKGLVVASVLGNSRNRDAARESAHTVIGTKVVAVPDGLATGFGTTWGVSNSDKIVTGYAEPINERSYFVRARRNGNGGGNLGRLFDKLSGLNGQGLFYEANTITYLEVTSTGTEARTAFPAPSLGEWFDVLVTRTKNGSDIIVSAYLNGVLAVTNTRTSGARDSAETPITIGNRADNIRVWNGLIACGYVWDRGLSVSDAYDLSQNPWRIFQPNKRRVWAVSAEPVTTPVSSELAATYSIKISVNESLAANYSISNSVAGDLAAAYAIKQSVASDISATYAVYQSVFADLQASYGVAQSVGAELVANYTVASAVSQVSADLVASYQVESAVSSVSADLDASYSISARVESDLAATYQVKAFVDSSLESTYAIRAKVSADLDALYAVAGAISSVGVDLVASYGIYSAIESKKVFVAVGESYLPASISVGHNGAYKSVAHGYVGSNGAWRKFYQSAAVE